MPEETTAAESQATSDEAANNTGNSQTGAGTESQSTQATEKTFTQAEVDAMFQKRLSKAVKAELKKLTGETEGSPSVDELTQRATQAETRLREFEAKDSVVDYLSDPKNRVNPRPENMRLITKLVVAELQYDEEGKPSNLKEAIAQIKGEAPQLFVPATGSANGGSGVGTVQTLGDADMTLNIRRLAGKA